VFILFPSTSIFSEEGEHHYDAECGLLKDRGIAEENNRTVKRLHKSARKHIEKYQVAINEIGKDKKTQLEEPREVEATKPASIKVVNGGPLHLDPPVIRAKSKLIGGELQSMIEG
jgi:hypothetical protein